MATIITVTMPPGPDVIEVQVPGIQGPSALSVGPTNTLTPGTQGLWIQTGLGPDGTGVTFWIEDGN